MDAFIYFPVGMKVDRDVVEDVLADALGDVGKVSGAGSGQGGSHVDLHIDDRAPHPKVLGLLKEALKLVGVDRAKIVINRTEHPFP